MKSAFLTGLAIVLIYQFVVPAIKPKLVEANRLEALERSDNNKRQNTKLANSCAEKCAPYLAVQFDQRNYNCICALVYSDDYR